MPASFQFAASITRPGRRRALASRLAYTSFMALFALAGCVTLLEAQNPIQAPTTAQGGPVTRLDELRPAPAAMDHRDQLPNQPAIPTTATPTTGNAPAWDRSMLDPFQPGPNFGNFAGFAGKGMSFNGAGSFNGSRQGGAGSLFAAGIAPAHGFAAGATVPMGATPSALPSLNQFMHRSFNAPFGSSPGAFRLTYQDTLRAAGALSDPGHPPTSVLFTSSDLGNGMFFSAGTGYGIKTMVGAPPAAFGSTTTAGPKHSGTAVNFKLSF